jgi:uncharacterized protein (TIGR04255 family)
MTWRYPNIEYTEYARNPLISTDIEIRFHPVLDIMEDTSKVAALRALLREKFPEYKLIPNRAVSVSTDGSLMVKDENQHIFSKDNGAISLYLGSESLRISSVAHQNKKTALDSLTTGHNALLKIFGTISLKRLGVRYVNVINRSDVEKGLGLDSGSLNWTDVIDSSFFSSPSNIVDLFDSTFMTQMKSNHSNGGELVLRYGLVQSGPSSPVNFRFDIDRFTDDPCDNQPLASTIDLFALDIFSLFHTMMGSKLKEWMSIEE